MCLMSHLHSREHEAGFGAAMGCQVLSPHILALLDHLETTATQMPHQGNRIAPRACHLPRDMRGSTNKHVYASGPMARGHRAPQLGPWMHPQDKVCLSLRRLCSLLTGREIRTWHLCSSHKAHECKTPMAHLFGLLTWDAISQAHNLPHNLRL